MMRIYKVSPRLTIISRSGKIYLVDTTQHKTIGTFERMKQAREAARRSA